MTLYSLRETVVLWTKDIPFDRRIRVVKVILVIVKSTLGGADIVSFERVLGQIIPMKSRLGEARLNKF